MTIDSITPEILQLVEARKWRELRSLLSNWEVPEVVDLLLDMEKKNRVLLFRALPRSRSAEVFSHLEPEDQDWLLRELTDAETRYILGELDPDDRTALLEELPAEATQKLMALLSPEDLREARQLLGYPEESVGRLMTPDYVSVLPEDTINQAFTKIRAQGRDSETINRIYIIDRTGKLLDDITLRQLVLADPAGKVEKVLDHRFVELSAFDDRERAVEILQEYDLAALPVVDSDGVLIGIVTFDDVMDVAEEEVTEDIQKAASIEPLKTSYRHASVWTLFRKRVIWLIILVVLNLVSAGIIAAYEHQLAAAISLVFFIPILLGSAGNTGSQSATIMLRALVTGDIEMVEWFKVFLKEIAVGLLLGASLGLLSWGLALFHGGYTIGLVVGLTMVSIVLVANFVGMTLPFILARLRLDPAVASSPLITTIADASGLLIYFSIATWLLP